MNERRKAGPMKQWKIVVMRPQRMLVLLNLGAATVLFGIALYMLAYGYWWTAMGWWLELLKAGAVLSVVAFAGSSLERR